jgi:hypothetical protein
MIQIQKFEYLFFTWNFQINGCRMSHKHVYIIDLLIFRNQIYFSFVFMNKINRFLPLLLHMQTQSE